MYVDTYGYPYVRTCVVRTDVRNVHRSYVRTYYASYVATYLHAGCTDVSMYVRSYMRSPYRRVSYVGTY